jgi:preprotein translocase subunit SecA
MPDYMNELLEQSGAVMRTVNDYLSSMADMQEMMANCIQVLMVELGGEDEE